MLKVCFQCKQEKEIYEFNKLHKSSDGHQYLCRECQRINSKEWNIKNKEKRKEYNQRYSKTYYIKNMEEHKKRSKEYRINNKEKMKRVNKNYYEKNKKSIIEYQRKYAVKNSTKVKDYKKSHYIKNREKIKENQIKNRPNNNERAIFRRANDINYRIKKNLRARINHALKQNIKSDHTLNLLGCSIEEFKTHLQQTAFENGYKDFNINDFSGRAYHVDHIVSCCLFHLKCSFHQKLCFHWTNMQILSAKDNLTKERKI